jgi:hypothetical protein
VALLSSCSSSSADTPPFPAFALADCQGQGTLVEIARLIETHAGSASTANGIFNNLAIDGDTLYTVYGYASTGSGLPASGGVVALSVSGGAPRVVGAADIAKTASWGVGNFWVSGGQVHLQTGAEIVSIPADSTTPTTLTFSAAQTATYGAYTEDADFGYAAQGDDSIGVTVTKTPIAGGAPTTLVSESLSDVSLSGLADAGDSLLLQVSWSVPGDLSGNRPARVWRIPKDGTPRSDARPDVMWADTLVFPQWLQWDGQDILGTILVRNYIGQARIAAAGSSSPQYLKLDGMIATRRGDEILSFQTVEQRTPQVITTRLLVASSKGAPTGSVVACGSEQLTVGEIDPGGIAASDSGIYVSYTDGHDTVIARVSP